MSAAGEGRSCMMRHSVRTGCRPPAARGWQSPGRRWQAAPLRRSPSPPPRPEWPPFYLETRRFEVCLQYGYSSSCSLNCRELWKPSGEGSGNPGDALRACKQRPAPRHLAGVRKGNSPQHQTSHATSHASRGHLAQLAQHEHAFQDVLHGRVRGGRAGGDADAHRAADGEEVRGGFDVAAERSVHNGVVRLNAVRRVDVVGREALVQGDLQEVSGVGRVPASHHEDEVERLVHLGVVAHVLDGVLADLRGVADGVEGGVALCRVLRPVLLDHGLLEELGDGARLLLVHGCLVGEPELAQVHVRVEALGDGVLEVVEEGLLGQGVLLAEHVLADHGRLLDVLDDDVVRRHGRSRHRLLVRPLAVHHRGHLALDVLVHGVPHLGHPGAGGVHHLDVLGVEELHLLEGSAEGRKDDHIPVFHAVEALARLRLLNVTHVHVREHVVHLGVVDELVGQVHLPVRELLARRPGDLDAALHAPAEAILLGEHKRHRLVTLAPGNLEGVGAHLLDEGALELVHHLRSHLCVHVLVEGPVATVKFVRAHDAAPQGPLVHLLGGFHHRSRARDTRGAHGIRVTGVAQSGRSVRAHGKALGGQRRDQA
mmetsp:Transcript_22858/g.67349  ORF Transcript_22858/g.67349 Transcript_22858/m.67349 type:complete len:597 (-) Transcript_22858:53-1843(-)